MDRLFLVMLLSATWLTPFAEADDRLPKLNEISIVSSFDGTEQPVVYWAPDSAKREPTVLFVFLHSWSSNYKQDNSKWQRKAVEQGWIYLHPNFRGANQSPQACGSPAARQDVLDAMDFAIDTFKVDTSRIYLAGVSGGGHMAMLMAGHHPERFSAVSAWVGISDVAEWYQFHLKDGQPQKYARMILKCFGAPPGTSATVDADYRDRSPLFHLKRVRDLPVDIFAGVNDGHSGSVPVSHSLRGFNEIAKTHGNPTVTDEEIGQLWTNRTLVEPQQSDMEEDKILSRKIFLRRTSGKSRVTIFDGGHESIPVAAIDWLKRQKRNTKRRLPAAP